MPKLRVSLSSKGKYWRAFEDIPDDQFPSFALKYLASESDIQQVDDVESKPLKAKKVSSYVKRGNAFVLASKVELIAGETLYWHRKRQFGIDEKFIVFGRVGSEA